VDLLRRPGELVAALPPATDLTRPPRSRSRISVCTWAWLRIPAGDVGRGRRSHGCRATPRHLEQTRGDARILPRVSLMRGP